jgi:hypothetical protein
MTTIKKHDVRILYLSLYLSYTYAVLSYIEQLINSSSSISFSSTTVSTLNVSICTFFSIIFCLMVSNTNAPAPRVIIILTIFTPAPNGKGCVNNSTKSSIIRPSDKDFYKKRNGDLKRKLVVRLVTTAGLLPRRTGLMKTWSSLRLQVLVMRKILKLPCIILISPNQNRHYF